MGSFLSGATGTGNGFQASPITQQNFAPGLQQSAGQFNNTFNLQNELAKQLGLQAQGLGPNPAQIMLNQATNRNIAQNAGFLASQKTLSPALAQRLAAQNAATAGQQAAGQGALMGAQQQLAAQQGLSNLYGQQLQGALGMNQNLQNAQANQNSAINGMSQINAGVASGNQQMGGRLVGGLIGGAAGALGLAHGGRVPNGIMPVQHLADGGFSSGFSSGFGGAPMGYGMAPQPMQQQAPLFNVPGTIRSWFSSPQLPASGPGSQQDIDSGGLLTAQDQQSEMEQSGLPLYKSEGGDVQGKVPGKASVKGDSVKNDKVPAMLSPGEIVIPRHITMHPNAPDLAAKFVELELHKQKMSCGGMANYADGGDVPPALADTPAPEVTDVPTQVTPDMPATPEFQAKQLANQIMSTSPGLPPDMAIQDANRMVNNQMDRDYWSKQNAPLATKLFSSPPAGAVQHLGESPDQTQGEAAPEDSSDQGPANMPQAMGSSSPSGGSGGGGSIDQYLNSRNQVFKDSQEQQANDNYRYGQKEWDLDVERENLMNDLKNGHVDPNHLFSTMGTGEKIRTALGLILGGMGSGLTGQPNAALELLNKKIDNDIKSQEIELGKNKSLLGYNLDKSRDIRAAREATRVMQRDLISDQLQGLETNSKDPMVRARAQNMMNQLQMQNAQSSMMLKMYQQMQSPQAQNGGTDQQLQLMRMVNPEMAKSIDSRYVPGVGVASIPVSDQNRKEIALRSHLDNEIQQLRSFAQTNQGSLSPAQRLKGEVLAKNVQDAYRQANGQGVFREAEAKFVGDQVPNPTKFFAKFRTDPAYAELQDVNRNSLNTILDQHGLRPVGAARPQANVLSFKPLKAN